MLVRAAFAVTRGTLAIGFNARAAFRLALGVSGAGTAPLHLRGICNFAFTRLLCQLLLDRLRWFLIRRLFVGGVHSAPGSFRIRRLDHWCHRWLGHCGL